MHVGTPGLRDRIVVDVNDTVEIASDDLSDIKKLVEVKRLLSGHKAGEGDGGKIAHGHLIR